MNTLTGAQRYNNKMDKIFAKAKKKCLYCDNLTLAPHFQSGCCQRGMCDECYDALTETEEQLQIDFCDEQTYKQFSKQIKEVESHGFAYLCFEHMVKN